MLLMEAKYRAATSSHSQQHGAWTEITLEPAQDDELATHDGTERQPKSS